MRLHNSKTINNSLPLLSGIMGVSLILPNVVLAGLPDPYKTVCQTIGGSNDRTQAQQNFFDICSPIAGEPNPDPTVIASLKHEEIAAQGTSTLQASREQLSNVLSRMGELHQGVTGSVASIAGGAAGDDDVSVLDANRWGFFVNGDIRTGDRKQTVSTDVLGEVNAGAGNVISSGERSFDFDRNEVTVGADYRLPGEKMVLGAAAGYNKQNGKFTSESGKIDVKGTHLSVYGTYLPSDNSYIDGVVSIGKNEINMSRPVPKLGGGFSNALANPDSNQLSASIGGGRDFRTGKVTITPYTRLDYAKTSIDAYEESVDDPASIGMTLRVKKQEVESMASTVGVRVSSPKRTSKGVFVPQFSVDWGHEFQNDARTIDATIIASDGLGVDGNPVARTSTPDRDYFRLGAGVSAVFSKGKSGFAYVESLQGSSDIKDTSVKFGYRMEF